MAGIYIHIPYCRQACSYCNFHFSVSWKKRSEFVKALCKEIELQQGFFESLDDAGEKPVIKTLYLGGGTPSVLSIGELTGIFATLDECFSLDAVDEITLEANPDDLTYEYLLSLRQTRVNRLSIGIQSFQQPDLDYMNRVHSPVQALQSLQNAQKAGFENISVDLIYGTPTLQEDKWRENLRHISEAGVPHVSAYALTVENKTPLEYYIRKGKLAPVKDDQTARHFEIMLELMRSKAYLHYEVSNFALPGHFSKHNLSYWQGIPYLGIGPSAHSFKHNQRFWNVANTSAYINSLKNGLLPQSGEVLSRSQEFNEYMMTSLRTMWGCDLAVVEEKWGNSRANVVKKAAQKYIDKGLLQDQGGHLILTDHGKLFADGIAADLFC
jgi:oxygen-independent coproporphyrinogen III oxidase